MSLTEREANVRIDDKDLSSLERLTYRKRWSTGLLDTTVGLAIVLIGLCWVFDAVVVGAVVPVMLIPLWALARDRIIVPRSGYSEQTEQRQEVERKALSLSALLGAIILIQVIAVIAFRPAQSPLLTGMLDMLAPGIPTFLLALLVFVGGIVVDQQRATAYALLMVNVGVVGSLLDLMPGPLMVVSGAVILANGSRMLYHFLRP